MSYSPVRKRPAQKGQYAPSRSVRIDDDVWEQAKVRAAKDGLKLSGAIQLLVEGYARGIVPLPRVRLAPAESPQEN